MCAETRRSIALMLGVLVLASLGGIRGATARATDARKPTASAPTEAALTTIAEPALATPLAQATLLPAPRWPLLAATETLLHLLLGESMPAVSLVRLHSTHFRQTRDFLLPLDGHLDDRTALELARFLRCHRTGHVKRIHAHLVAMLADVGRRFPGQTIEVVSAHRIGAQESRSSPHRHARAIDIRIENTSLAEIRDYVWSHHRRVGVGYYPRQGFVHLDHRDDDIAWTQPKFNADYLYSPRWAALARL